MYDIGALITLIIRLGLGSHMLGHPVDLASRFVRCDMKRVLGIVGKDGGDLHQENV